MLKKKKITFCFSYYLFFRKALYCSTRFQSIGLCCVVIHMLACEWQKQEVLLFLWAELTSCAWQEHTQLPLTCTHCSTLEIISDLTVLNQDTCACLVIFAEFSIIAVYSCSLRRTLRY